MPMDDERDFGRAIFEVLDRRRFRRTRRDVDSDGWGIITYAGGRMGVRLVYHMGTSIELMPGRDMNEQHSIDNYAEVIGPPLPPDATNDEKAAYLDREFERIEPAFAERDGGAVLASIRRRNAEENRRLWGMR
jgi:hypothetical protein